MINTGLIKDNAVSKVRRVLDIIITYISVCGFVFLFSLVLAWFISPVPKSTSIDFPRQQITVQVGAKIHPRMLFRGSVDAVHANYDVQLLNDSHNEVFAWPRVPLVNPRVINFAELQDLAIPAQLRPGQYKLNIRITYVLNPFKTSSINVVLPLSVISTPPLSDTSSCLWYENDTSIQ